MITLGISNICKAFDDACVGTRVVKTGRDFVKNAITEALVSYRMPANGQGFVLLSRDVCACVFSGDTPREGLTEEDVIVKEWRGELMMFARRTPALSSFAAAVVYTREAYLADPEVLAPERKRLTAHEVTHVLVALLGSRGPKPTLSSTRFVRNLAGGNASFAPGQRSYEDLVEMAQEIVAYEASWITVADA